MSKQYQLPREFAEKWVKALRGGEYKQGKRDLGTKEYGYCCLGVAGILCGAKDEMYTNHKNRSAYLIQGDSEIYAGTTIPDEIFAAIPDQLKGAFSNELVAKLSGMNDNGYSFPEIADWIEQNVEFV